MQMQDRIVINDYIQGDPLSEENLDKTLETVDRFRLLFPNKSIWLYSGYQWQNIFMNEEDEPFEHEREFVLMGKRQSILKQCDVMVDGRYIDSQRNPQAKWRGSDNQRVISVQESLKQNKIVLYCD